MKTIQSTGLQCSYHWKQFKSSIMSFTSPVQGRCEIFLAKKEENYKSLRCKCKIYFCFHSLVGFLFLKSLQYWFLEVCVNINQVSNWNNESSFQETVQRSDSSKHKLIPKDLVFKDWFPNQSLKSWAQFLIFSHRWFDGDMLTFVPVKSPAHPSLTSRCNWDVLQLRFRLGPLP